MEAQLKALKVPELKAILHKAGLPVTGKKDDLIARIIASPPAIASLKPADAVASADPPAGGAPDDDLLAPPEEFDWGAGASNGDAAVATAVPRAATNHSTSAVPSVAATTVLGSSPVVTAASAPSTSTNNADPKPASVTPGVPPQVISAAESTAKVVGEDDEMAKRRARAARFGVPFVEPTKLTAKSTPKATGTQAHTNADPGLEAKKTARVARFGLQNAGEKPHASNPKPPADPAEEEKKRKRAERFGLVKAEGPDTKKTKTS